MNEDERQAHSILVFTFKKLDEELLRPDPQKERTGKDSAESNSDRSKIGEDGLCDLELW